MEQGKVSVFGDWALTQSYFSLGYLRQFRKERLAYAHVSGLGYYVQIFQLVFQPKSTYALLRAGGDPDPGART